MSMQRSMDENKLKVYKTAKWIHAVLENGQKCVKLPKSLQNAPLEKLKVANTVSLSCPWISYHRFNLTWIKKIFRGKKIPESSKKKNLNLPQLSTMLIPHEWIGVYVYSAVAYNQTLCHFNERLENIWALVSLRSGTIDTETLSILEKKKNRDWEYSLSLLPIAA